MEELTHKGQRSARQFKRATGLLELDRGKTLRAVAQTLGISHQVVSTWRDNYQREGVKALLDKPRPGRPIEIDGAQRAKITALACSKAPSGPSRWDLRLLADKAVALGYCDHISHTQVATILKNTR